MARHSSPWLRLNPVSMLAVANLVVSCSGAETTEVRSKKPGAEVAQGPGTSESDDDFTVAQPVPMALLDPTFLADNKERFDQSGASGNYQQASENDCAAKINPMDTDDDDGLSLVGGPRWSLTSGTGAPKNLCISLNIMSVPGYASGEMKSLLDSLLTLSNKLFGKQGFFGAGFETKKAVRVFNLLKPDQSHAVGTPSYAEIVVVNPGLKCENNVCERKIYRVNLYFPNLSGANPTKFSLATSLEFSPLADDENFADIAVSHSIIPENLMVQHLEAKYNTKSGEFSATFGSNPIDVSVPAVTTLRWLTNNEYFLIQGGYIWQKDSSSLLARTPKAFAPPVYYKPFNNDVVFFQSITKNDSVAKTVQSTAYLPENGGEIGTAAVDHTIWLDQNAGYTKDLIRYLVELLRNPGINPSCSQLRTTIVNTLNNATPPIAVPSSISTLPQDNICSTNSVATDQQVETLLKESCKLISVNMDLNLSVEGVAETRRVKLCAKLIEALLLSNHQFIEVMEDESGVRSRQPKVDYRSDQFLIGQLLSKAAPDAEYAALQTTLLEESFKIDVEKLRTQSWPAVETKDPDYFEKNARGQL